MMMADITAMTTPITIWLIFDKDILLSGNGQNDLTLPVYCDTVVRTCSLKTLRIRHSEERLI